MNYFSKFKLHHRKALTVIESTLNLSNFKIKSKIIIVFGLIMISMGILNLWTFYNSYNYNKSYNKINQSIKNADSILKNLDNIEPILRQIVMGRKKIQDGNQHEIINGIYDVINISISNSLDNDKSHVQLDMIKGSIDTLNTNITKFENQIKNGYSVNENEKLLENIRGIIQIAKDNTQQLISMEVSNSSDLLALIEVSFKRSVTIYISIFCMIFTLFSIYILALSRNISEPIRKMCGSALMIADGDLTVDDIYVKSKDEINDLAYAFNKMKNSIRVLANNINESILLVNKSSLEVFDSLKHFNSISDQIGSAVHGLTQGALEQAKGAEEGSNQLTEIVENLKEIKNEIVQSENLVNKAQEYVVIGQGCIEHQSENVNKNNEITTSIAKTMNELSTNSKEIENIVELIKQITGQTSLLSLNAAIEAARAGEAGKGFAVVADEVKKLAEQTAYSTENIINIINNIKTQILGAVKEMSNAKTFAVEQSKTMEQIIKSFEDIHYSIDKTKTNINEIVLNANKLNDNAIIVEQKIQSIASVAQEVAANSEEISSSTSVHSNILQTIVENFNNLDKLSEQLKESISKFKF